VSVARARGAEIFATAGSEDKRTYLRSLGIRHVLPSRTAEFAEEVMRLTSGRGVDVVLNSLTGLLAEKTLSVLAKGGCFLEVGKRDTLTRQEVRQMRPDVRHFVYDLGEEATEDPTLVPSLLEETLRLLAKDASAILPVSEFDDPRDAFRTMAQARHVGKIVIRQRHLSNGFLRPDPNATYLITGGCGGLGLLFAERLAEQGARFLVLVGRSEPRPAATAAIESMRSRGAEVTVATADIGNLRAVETLLEAIPASRPLRGILHAAGVLDDHSLLEQSQQTFAAVMQPKWVGGWNLHTLTRKKNLDFFVMFSSAAAWLGSPGQANYAAANAMLDALAVYRRGLNLPALSVQWGPWNAAGMTEKLKTDLREAGLGRIEHVDGLDALQALLGGHQVVATVLPVLSRKTFANQRARNAATSSQRAAGNNQEQRPTERSEFYDDLRNAPIAQRGAMLSEHLRGQALHILSLPAQTRIDEDEALHDLGLDSLMAVELRNALIESLHRQLPPTMVLDYPTLRTLNAFLLTEVFGAQSEQADETFPDEFSAMSEEEAEALLIEELGRQGHGTGR
jgi:NADP-dependent 3-hydroxy acid dehydrogenase YdfG/acyl carrier protein